MRDRHTSRSPRPAFVLTAGLVTGAVLACGDDRPTAPAEGSAIEAPALAMGTAQMNADLATLRRVSARYHRVDAAIEDGFTEFLPCVEDPAQGALGVVYAHLPRVLDGTLDVAEPEVLFYEPQKNGRLRLIGVETAIPIALWTASDPPSMFGHEFHRNDEHGLYGIHIWVWRHNPDGTFAFWHPEASCEFAG